MAYSTFYVVPTFCTVHPYSSLLAVQLIRADSDSFDPRDLWLEQLTSDQWPGTLDIYIPFNCVIITNIWSNRFYASGSLDWPRASRIYQAVRPTFCPFVCYQSCEHDISKTDEPILGHSRSMRQEDETVLQSEGQSWRSHDAEVRRGGGIVSNFSVEWFSSETKISSIRSKYIREGSQFLKRVTWPWPSFLLTL